MSIDPYDLKRFEEGRWPTSWKGALRVTRPGERFKVMFALATKAAPVSPELELGELLEQILIRYAAEAERRRCCRPGKGEMRMLANGA